MLMSVHAKLDGLQSDLFSGQLLNGRPKLMEMGDHAKVDGLQLTRKASADGNKNGRSQFLKLNGPGA